MNKLPKKRTKKYHQKSKASVPMFVARTLEAPESELHELREVTRTLLLRLHLGTATTEMLQPLCKFLLLGILVLDQFESQERIDLVVRDGMDALFMAELALDSERQPSRSTLVKISSATDMVYEQVTRLSYLDFKALETFIQKYGDLRVDALRTEFLITSNEGRNGSEAIDSVS